MGKIRTRNQHQAEFVKCIQKFGGKYQTWEIYADFISMFACAISNGIDRVHFKPREEMYMQIIRKYTNEEQAIFPEMMGHVINGMEENRDCDFLGELYMALDLGSHWKGQFFAPYSLCKMTAQLQKNDIEQEITEQENKIKEERDSKIRKLKELAERTYTLRRNFVKDFTLNEKATSKNLQNFIITALLEDNDFDIEKFIEMLDVEYDEDDLDEMQGVREVYERSNKTLQNKMVIAGYVLYNDRKTNDCYDYTGNHRENESLQRLYDGLITIGYEMSDEELAMMDGTHELYTTEDE